MVSDSAIAGVKQYCLQMSKYREREGAEVTSAGRLF